METAPASKGYAGGFGTDLMLKDLGLAQENAAAVRACDAAGRPGAQPVRGAQPRPGTARWISRA